MDALHLLKKMAVKAFLMLHKRISERSSDTEECNNERSASLSQQ